MSSAKPKSAKPARAPAVEPDPAALLPADLPAECPFQFSWQPAVFAVHAAEGINLGTIKDAFKQLHVLSHVSLGDLAARLDPADPLTAEVAAAAAEGQQHAAALEGASVPVGIAAKLLQRQFAKDEALAWKFEAVKRREQCQKLEADAQVVQDALTAAEAANAAACSRLQAVKARLPQPVPLPAAAAQQQESSSQPQAHAAVSRVAADHDEPGAPASSAAVPPLDLQQLTAAAEHEVVLTPEQRRSLSEAQNANTVAAKALEAAQAAAAATGAALTAAREGLGSPFVHYEPYWVDGLPSTAAGLSAAVQAGIPVRAVLWLHPTAPAPLSETATARVSVGGSSTRPASGASTRLSQAGSVACVMQKLPAELQQLQDAVAAAAWDSELAGLLVLQVPVEDAASVFSRVPAGSCITDPTWAAASSAAAAAKAAAAAAAALDVKPASTAGAKPGSAVAGMKSTSGGQPARPGSSVAGNSTASSAAAAAAPGAAPEEVLGCKELARALLTIRDQFQRFNQWHTQHMHVYRMPGPFAASAVRSGDSSAPRMGYYKHLLDSVRPERQSVPLVLHAMLEQVQQNGIHGDLPAGVTEAGQAVLAAQVEDALGAAFSSLVDADSCLLRGALQEPCALTVLQHGDNLAAAACGLSTGYVQGHPSLGSCPAAAAAMQPATMQGLPTSRTCVQDAATDWGFAARGLSDADVNAVEQHMLHLLQGTGLLGKQDQANHHSANDLDPVIAQQLQQAELRCLCQDVHCSSVQRVSMLQAAKDMLPAEVQAAHGNEITCRHHQEQLQPQVLLQALQCSSLEYPDAVSGQDSVSGTQLLAFFAGPELQRCCNVKMPHVMTFQQYWKLMLQDGCREPELAPKVYEMSADAASHHWQQRLLYTDEGGMAITGTGGILAFQQAPATVRLLQPELPGEPYQLVATLEHGTVVAASVLKAPPPSGPAPEPHSGRPSSHADTFSSDAPSVPPPAAPADSGTASAAAKKRPVSGAKAAAVAVQGNTALASVAEGGGSAGGRIPVEPMAPVPECDELHCPDTEASTPSEAAANARTTPEWVVLSVTTPQGLSVQLSTDGCVLLAPVVAPAAQSLYATGVDVLGAPQAAGKLQGRGPGSASGWHAVLLDGSLIKGAATQRGELAAAAAATTAAAAAANGDSPAPPVVSSSSISGAALTVLHPDGQVSQQHQLEVPLVGVAGDVQQAVAGWVRTAPKGERTWVVDATALQDLRQRLAKAAQAAAEAAAAAAAASAAAAAAAAEASSKKGGKGDKKGLGKSASSKAPKQPQQQQEPAAAPGVEGGSGGTCEQEQTSNAVDAALLELEQQPPKSMGNIRAVQLTDADTGAIVTTREDHLLIVDYPDGSRLLQDAEGCRVSHVQGSWMVEAAGLPVIQGDSRGVTLQPCPGLCLRWCSATRAITLTHTASGATLLLTPSGHAAYSTTGSAADAFSDLCCSTCCQPEDQHHVVQQQEPGDPTQMVPDALQQQQADAPQLQAGEGGQQLQHEQQAAPGADACVDEGLQAADCCTLVQEVCGQPECWGLLGLDLMTGEAALYEEGACRLHIGPGGCLQVWNDGSEPYSNDASNKEGVCLEESAAEPAAGAEPVQHGEQPTAPAPDAPSGGAADEGLDDEELAARAAAAAAAAHAAAEAAAAQAAAAEAAAAAAAARPRPVAPGIKPRVFAINKLTGAGCELLPQEALGQYVAALSSQPATQHQQQEELGAAEPGTLRHTFLTTYACRDRALLPLQLATPTQVVPVEVDPQQSLVSLRRVDTVVQAEWQAGQGLKLPRIAALNPWSLAPAITAASSMGCGGIAAGREPREGALGSLAATRHPVSAAAGSGAGGGAGCSGGQVVVVRDVLELPVLGPEVLAKVQEVLAAWHHKCEQQQLAPSRVPSPGPASQQLRADAQEVSSLLAAAGFTPVPPPVNVHGSEHKPQPAGTAVIGGHGCHDGSGSEGTAAVSAAPTTPDRLQEVRSMLLEQQQLAAAAHEKAKAEAAAREGAEAAARQKPKRPWPKKVGPYDHTPQKPQPGHTLAYFSTQEGLEALARDPGLQPGNHLTRASLPPAKPPQPATAGKQQVPGVYLAASTTLCDDVPNNQHALDPAEASAAGLALLAATGSPRGRSSNPRSHSTSPGGTARGVLSPAGSRPQHAPLMHAGRPTRLGSPVPGAQGDYHHHHQQQQQQQGEMCGADAACAYTDSSRQAGVLASSGSSGGSSAERGAVLDVYGQPRVVSPALPSTYSKARAAGSPNHEYLAREGAALRATKTCSANLVRDSGKDGEQIVLRPAHLHFGTIPAGSVAHRTAKLLNGSADVVRFTICRPELPLRVLHKPAPLPPGMETSFTVELVAEQPGDFVGDITVKTELKVFVISVSAKVVAS